MNNQALKNDRNAEIISIASEMMKSGLSSKFFGDATKVAFEFEGVYDLMKLWQEEESQQERDEIVADIQEMIDECSQKEKVDGTYIRFDDLDEIAKDVISFKDSLRLLVEKKGGIKTLSEKTGIPQPSLSRFFSSASIPRRVTLLKIAKALELSQVEIATEWSK